MQVKVMLGLGHDHVPRNMRAGGLFVTWAHIITESGHSLLPSVILAACCIIFLTFVKYAQSRLESKLKVRS